METDTKFSPFTLQEETISWWNAAIVQNCSFGVIDCAISGQVRCMWGRQEPQELQRMSRGTSCTWSMLRGSWKRRPAKDDRLCKFVTIPISPMYPHCPGHLHLLLIRDKDLVRHLWMALTGLTLFIDCFHMVSRMLVVCYLWFGGLLLVFSS